MLHKSRSLTLLLIGAALAALMVVGTGCDEGDVEELLGDMSAASIESAYEVDRDPLINEWMTNRGHTIVSHTRRQNIPYEFSVIDTDLVNAFAAPYGHVYVTSGFLDFTESEDEVGMVLAHEVGHIVNRDSIKQFKQSIMFGVLAQIISGESNTAGDVVGIGLGLLSLQYSRDDEYDADDAGTMYSYAMGYDPHEGLDFFDRLMTEVEKRRPSRWEVYFMTHPRTEDRIARQLKRPELDENNAQSLMRIARGYVLRGQPSRAAQLLEKSVEQVPDLAEAHALLGDALAMRGQTIEAEDAYRTALNLNSDIRYAETRLAALSEMPPDVPAGIGIAGRQQAEALLARLNTVRSTAATTRAQAQSYQTRTEPRLTAMVGTVRDINGRLVELAGDDTPVSDATQQSIVRGNAAVSKAIEPVYVLERVNQDLEDSSGEIQTLLAEAQSALEQAEAGNGNPEDIPALRTAVGEIERAISTIDVAMAEAPSTIEQVANLQSSARDVTTLMEQVARIDDPNDLASVQLNAQAAHTQSAAIEALAAVNRAKRQSVQAKGHALVARLNLLAAGATPAEQKVYDAQVAYYLLVPEAQVRALRSTGAGFGEAALALAASKSLTVEPRHFMPSVASGISPVAEAMERGAAVSNANVLLKFLAASMEAEHDAQKAM